MDNAYTDNTPMPFGKHKGKAMVNVPAKYLLILLDMGCNIGKDADKVKRYILDNIEVLRKEAGQ